MGEPAATAALLAAIGVLLVLAGLASPLSSRLGVPALVVFLGLGMLAGSEGVGGIPFDDYSLAFRLGTIALVLILFDGALNTAPTALRRAAVPAGLLSTVSVVATAALVAGFGIALGLEPAIALLVGAVVSSTDAAATFTVLRSSGVRLRESTAATLEVESGVNDPMAILLTMVATEIALGHAIGPGGIALLFVQQFGVGGVVGVGTGYAARGLLRHVQLPAAGLYPVLTLAIAFLSFGIATLLGGSGFVAVYATGLVLAAGAIPYGAGVRRVHDALAWLSQIMMFTLLGLLVFPTRLVPTLGVGLAIALFLAVVARPLAVAPVLAALRVPRHELAFISWVGLRGAVPIILGAYPAVAGYAQGDELFHLVFFVVLASSFVPGATVGWVARRLGIADPSPHTTPVSIELVSLRELPGDFVWYHVSRASAVEEAFVRDLPLPDGCLVTLIVRDADRSGGKASQVVVPRGSTQFVAGDQVCIFVLPEGRELLDLLFGGPAETD
jgi:cell volume regulation protein A